MAASRVDKSAEWARRVISAETGERVELHDDGSRPSMYDLRVGPESTPAVAIEVTGAVDPAFTATWNTGPADGPMDSDLRGDWTVELMPGTFLKRIAPPLLSVLRTIEDNHDGEVSVAVDHMLRRYNRDLYDELESIGVSYVNCYRPAGSGKVSFVMAGSGGAVDSSGDSVPAWVSEWTREPQRADNLTKLSASGADRRELFVFVTLEGAPWSVVSYLTGGVESAPSEPPDLPSPLTGVWVCPTHGERGIYWTGEGWRIVNVRDD